MSINQDISQLYLKSLKEMIRELVQKELVRSCAVSEVVPTQEDSFLDAKAASQFLSISIHTLRTKAQEKKIPHYKKGNRLLFLKSELKDWVKLGRVKTYEEIQREVKIGLTKKLKL